LMSSGYVNKQVAGASPVTHAGVKVRLQVVLAVGATATVVWQTAPTRAVPASGQVAGPVPAAVVTTQAPARPVAPAGQAAVDAVAAVFAAHTLLAFSEKPVGQVVVPA
jgi:hypothetical protein